MTHQQKIAHAVSRFQIRNADCLQENSTENLLTIGFPLCSSANHTASAALGIYMDIYSKSDSTARRLVQRGARQTTQVPCWSRCSRFLKVGDLRGDLYHIRFHSYPMAGKRLGCKTIGVKPSVPFDSEYSNSKRFCSQHISS